MGSVFDGIGVFNYYMSGANHPLSVNPAKAGINLGVGIYSFYLNPVIAPLYFGVDLFYPGGWPTAIQNQNRLILENQKILGSGWNMYRDYTGGY